MAKRLLALFLILVFSLSFACGEETSGDALGDMKVVKCKEWVSLRQKPSTAAKRLKKVPLGATVTDCKAYSKEFVSCTYEGQSGYILAEYLEPLNPQPSTAAQTKEDDGGDYSEQIMLNASSNGYTVRAVHQLADSGEQLVVTATGPDGQLKWVKIEQVKESGELTSVSAFLAGTQTQPRVLIYNAEKGLYAVDMLTGETAWEIKQANLHLGGGVCCAVKEDGTMYLGSYYDNDPIAIGMDGAVQWRASAPGCSWLYLIALDENGLVCRYDMMDDNPDQTGTIYFSWNGQLVNKVNDAK